MESKKGFILIEVILSVMILSLVSLALLKIESTQDKLYKISRRKSDFTLYSSIIINSRSTNLHKKNLNLYDLTKTRYNIKNSLLKKFLKTKNINYSQTYRNIINSEGMEFLIDNIRLKDKNGTVNYITVHI